MADPAQAERIDGGGVAMTAATCPHCGAPELCRGAGVAVWKCGSGSDGMRSWNCKRWVELRISQLKRMLECAESRAWAMENACPEDVAWAAKHRPRMVRLAKAFHRELDRLRGQR